MDLVMVKRNMFSILIIAVGCLPLLFGFFQLSKRIIFISNSEIVMGTIVDFETMYEKRKPVNKRRRTTYKPIIKFVDSDGVEKTYNSNSNYRKDKHTAGQTIELRVSKYYPHVAVNDFKDIWSMPVYLILFGLAMMALGYSKFN